MVRLRRVWKLYIFYTTALVVLMAVSGLVLQVQLRKRLQAHLQEDVQTLVKVVAKALPDTVSPTVLAPWCRDVQNIADVRVTVMTGEGNVVGDSTGEAVVGEMRADRPEVAGALKSGIATAVRHSETIRDDMLYVALDVKNKGKLLRLGMSMKRVRMIESQVMGLLSLVLFLTPVLAMVLSYAFARSISPEQERYMKRSSAKESSLPQSRRSGQSLP